MAGIMCGVGGDAAVLPSDIWEDAARLGRAILLDAIRLAARGTPSSPVAEAGLFFNLEKDMTNRCVAALGVALAFGATAASSAEKHRDLHIVIETIDHSKQRYPTVGDWQIDKAGNLHITVSKMSDQRYEFLIGMHEAIEAYLAIHAGVSPEAVDKFDSTRVSASLVTTASRGTTRERHTIASMCSRPRSSGSSHTSSGSTGRLTVVRCRASNPTSNFCPRPALVVQQGFDALLPAVNSTLIR